jgi:hypothetical protein
MLIGRCQCNCSGCTTEGVCCLCGIDDHTAMVGLVANHDEWLHVSPRVCFCAELPAAADHPRSPPHRGELFDGYRVSGALA